MKTFTDHDIILKAFYKALNNDKVEMLKHVILQDTDFFDFRRMNEKGQSFLLEMIETYAKNPRYDGPSYECLTYAIHQFKPQGAELMDLAKACININSIACHDVITVLNEDYRFFHQLSETQAKKLTKDIMLNLSPKGQKEFIRSRPELTNTVNAEAFLIDNMGLITKPAFIQLVSNSNLDLANITIHDINGETSLNRKNHIYGLAAREYNVQVIEQLQNMTIPIAAEDFYELEKLHIKGVIRGNQQKSLISHLSVISTSIVEASRNRSLPDPRAYQQSGYYGCGDFTRNQYHAICNTIGSITTKYYNEASPEQQEYFSQIRKSLIKQGVQYSPLANELEHHQKNDSVEFRSIDDIKKAITNIRDTSPISQQFKPSI